MNYIINTINIVRINKMANHKKLDFYNMSLELDLEISQIVESLNKKKEYDLARQMNRASISIGSNISEGAGKNSVKDYLRFLRISKGSSNELETQLLMAKNRRLISIDTYDRVNSKLVLIKRKLSGYIRKIRENHNL